MKLSTFLLAGLAFEASAKKPWLPKPEKCGGMEELNKLKPEGGHFECNKKGNVCRVVCDSEEGEMSIKPVGGNSVKCMVSKVEGEKIFAWTAKDGQVAKCPSSGRCVVVANDDENMTQPKCAFKGKKGKQKYVCSYKCGKGYDISTPAKPKGKMANITCQCRKDEDGGKNCGWVEKGKEGLVPTDPASYTCNKKVKPTGKPPKPTGEKPTDEKPTGKPPKPTGEKPTDEKPTGKPPKPTGEKPTGEKPTGGKPTGGKPTGEKPTGEKPTGEKPTGGKPTGGKPTGEKPTGEKPTGGKPTGGKPTGEKPTGEKPTGGKPTGEKPTGGKPTGGKPTGGKPTDEKPTGGKPTGKPPKPTKD
jgi:hypothetical protein